MEGILQFNGDENNIEDVVEFLNRGLVEGFKVSELREVLCVGEKSLQRQLKSFGYKYNQKTKSYIKDNIDATNVVVKSECKSNTTKVVTKSNYNCSDEKRDIKLVKDNSNIAAILDAVNKMNNMTDKFEQMYNWYEMQTKLVDIPDKPELKINLNNDETVTRSMRLYLNTHKKFTAFCKAHKDKKVQDILDTALTEFLDKYDVKQKK